MDDQERNHEALIDRFAEQARIIRHRNDRIAEVEARANELALELAHAATRAEKATAQLHDALDEQAKLIRERDEAWERLAEAAEEIRQQGETIAELAAEPRPLTADDITDEMVERALNAYRDVRRQQGYVLARSDKTEAMAHALRVALTPPPARPEGAEKVEAVLNQYWSGDIDGTDLADRIVEEMNR